MKRTILAVLLLGIVGTAIFFLYIKQPAKTITIGEYEAVSHLDVSLDMLNTEFINSSDDKIHVQIKGHQLNKNMVNIREEYNRLVMEEQQKKKWTDHIHIRQTPTILVQLPKGQLKTLTLHTDDSNLNINDLVLESVEVRTSAGDVILENMSISYADIQSKDGSVSIAESTIENLSITTNAGDVAIKESKGITHKIQTVDGQIYITEAKEQPKVQAKSASGDIRIHYKKTPDSLRLTTAGEDIEILLPHYNKKAHIIGKGVNMLSAETEDGAVLIK
ncbi:DUF4097 domain-containing protein [Cytobacillus solani]|uniref:DUF4097 family beta strand repeat-containing protein n=1 Tax=Cytobacillus solani TaxID=1637975 RepID=UPI00207AFDE9|nr:DUF4097 family beta strand repeat-containing protein [Cytobacillus solani]USK55513.1 DUF4097 domain-containing protein [Cytobacillus solani]